METEKPDPAQRIRRLITKHQIMPRLAFQYRLCEAGAARLVHELLPFHLGMAERAGDIATLEQNIYILPSRRRFDNSNDAIQDLLNYELGNHSPELDELNAMISDTLRKNKFEVSKNQGTTAKHCRQLDVQTRNGPASVMLILKGSAITVDDPEFWKFLSDCALRERQPYILARSVSRATFPVLKALGARALQFYFIPLQSELADEELLYQAAAEELGVPPVHLTSKWTDHPVNDLLTKQLNENQPGMQTVAARQAIALASARGFDKTRVSPKKIRRWATDVQTRHAINLPQKWSIMMKDWTELERDRESAYATEEL